MLPALKLNGVYINVTQKLFDFSFRQSVCIRLSLSVVSVVITEPSSPALVLLNKKISLFNRVRLSPQSLLDI